MAVPCEEDAEYHTGVLPGLTPAGCTPNTDHVNPHILCCLARAVPRRAFQSDTPKALALLSHTLVAKGNCWLAPFRCVLWLSYGQPLRKGYIVVVVWAAPA